MLLTEYLPLQYDMGILLESSFNANTPIVLKNVLLQKANAENQNMRVYPKDLLMREAERYADVVKDRRAVGELDHSNDPVVNLKNVCHKITDIYWDGDHLMGTLEILSTPSGNIVKELMKNNIRLGISSRGVGSTSRLGEGTTRVEDDFQLICWDIVSNPSVRNAFINESVDTPLRKKMERINDLIVDFISTIS